jgi:hypothetical protein
MRSNHKESTMFARTLTLSTLAGLLGLALGCAAEEGRAPQQGRLQVSVHAASDDARLATLEGSLMIVGVDRAWQRRVDLATAAERTLDVSLPPGLYGVSWSAEPAIDGSDAERPLASSLPVLVVITSDRASAVDVHAVPDASLPGLSAQLAGSTENAALAAR